MVRSTEVGYTLVRWTDAGHSTSSSPVLSSVKWGSKWVLHRFLLWIKGHWISKMSYVSISSLFIVWLIPYIFGTWIRFWLPKLVIILQSTDNYKCEIYSLCLEIVNFKRSPGVSVIVFLHLYNMVFVKLGSMAVATRWSERKKKFLLEIILRNTV